MGQVVPPPPTYYGVSGHACGVVGLLADSGAVLGCALLALMQQNLCSLHLTLLAANRCVMSC